MGWSAGLKLRRLVENVSRILAVEARLRGPGPRPAQAPSPRPGHRRLLERIRREIPFIEKDTFLAPYLGRDGGVVRSGALLAGGRRVDRSARLEFQSTG